jgi:cell division protein FtsB
MTGLEVPAPRPQPPEPAIRVRLPASRAGIAWLIALLVVGGFLAFQIGRQVQASWSINRQAEQLAAEIAGVEAGNDALRRELEYLQSDAYVSAEVRKLLNMGRPGERILIIPPGAEVPPPAATADEVTAPPPLLEQWLELFFGR